MQKSDATVHILAESEEESCRLVDGLRSLGFEADAAIKAGNCIGCKQRNDIVVVAGRFYEQGRRRLPPLCHANRDRIIVFLADMRSEEFGALYQAGVRHIETIGKVPTDNIVYHLSQMDPEMVYRASKQRALRADKSLVIEQGALSFFKKLRDGAVDTAIEETEQQRRAIEDLVAMSPMSVWLDLFQNYHDGTAQHCSLVTSFTLMFAKALGFGERETGRIYDAAFFHDVGKAMIPLEILDKPGRLDSHEWDVMKQHVLFGHDILMRDERTAGEIARLARDHHEYLDGTGYPNGATAAGIDDPTRILTICDIFAALVEKRSYKSPKKPEEAYAILKSMAGTKLDPDLVSLFERVVDDYDAAGRRARAGKSFPPPMRPPSDAAGSPDDATRPAMLRRTA